MKKLIKFFIFVYILATSNLVACFQIHENQECEKHCLKNISQNNDISQSQIAIFAPIAEEKKVFYEKPIFNYISSQKNFILVSQNLKKLNSIILLI